MERSKLAPFFKRRQLVHYEKSSKNKAPKKWAIKPLFGVYLWDVLTKKIPARGRATQQKRSATHYELPTAGLVRETGLEPVRQRHTPLKRACLPIPAFSHIPVCTEHLLLKREDYYSIRIACCQQIFYYFFAEYSRICRSRSV